MAARKTSPISIDVRQLRKLLTDTGLETWARKYGLPSTRRKDPREQLAIRLLYAVVAPGAGPLFERALKDAGSRQYLSTVINRVVAEVATLPATMLRRELTLAMTLPNRLPFYATIAIGPGIELGADAPIPSIDREYRWLEFRKSLILANREKRKYYFLFKGFLSIFGADFLLDIFDPEEFEAPGVIDLFLLGQWERALLKFLAALARLLKRLWTEEGLWRRLVAKYGRWGTLRLLAGLGARANLAILLAMILISWGLVLKDWAEEDSDYEERLRELYDSSDHRLKDDIFMVNMGRIPAPLPEGATDDR